MSLTDDVNGLPVTPADMMPGHLNNHATIHSALKNHNTLLTTRASITWSFEGPGVPTISNYPGIKVGDYIVRKSDGQEWRIDP